MVLFIILFYIAGRYSLLEFRFNDWITGVLFLSVLIYFALKVFTLNEKRNAQDILFYNSTLAILSIFMVGIIASDPVVWRYIVISLAVVATGEKIVGFLLEMIGYKINKKLLMSTCL